MPLPASSGAAPCPNVPARPVVTLSPVPQSFREELESLIQEQMKKGNNSSHVWALRQIADFMATTSPAALPTSPMGTWGWGRGGLGTLTRGLIEGGGVGKAPKPWGTPNLCNFGISKTLGPQKALGIKCFGTTKPLGP